MLTSILKNLIIIFTSLYLMDKLTKSFTPSLYTFIKYMLFSLILAIIIYFCKIHGWEPESVAGSPLKCQYYPRESSEQTMSEDLIQSWNWYFVTKKIKS